MRLSGTRRLSRRALARPVAFGITLIIAWWAVTLMLAAAPRTTMPLRGTDFSLKGAALAKTYC